MTLTGNERGILVGYATGVSLHHNVITNTLFSGAVPDWSGMGDGITAFELLDSQIKDNVISGSSHNGIHLWTSSDDNMIMNNQVMANERGIVIDNAGRPSTGNMIKKNEALGNSVVDLLDLNPGCDSNTWKNNTFGTGSPAGCIH